MISKLRLIVLFACLVRPLTGCRCSSKPEPVRPEPSAAPAIALVTPSASSSAAPPAQAFTKPVGSVRASIALADAPDQAIGDQNVPLAYHVFRVRGATLVSSGNQLYKLDGHVLSTTDADGLGTHELYGGKSPPLWMDVDELVGSWPTELWAFASGVWRTDGARIDGDFADLYHGVNGSFSRVPDGRPANLRAVAAWSQGRVLALEDEHFRFLTGGKAAVPKLTAGTSADCPVRVHIESIAALPSGELYGLGRACNGEGFWVERWSDAAVESKAVDPLPAAFSSPLSSVSENNAGSNGSSARVEVAWLVAGGGDSVYALRSGAIEAPGRVRLAHFDGTAWQELALPVDLPIRAADATPDGSLWITTGFHAYVLDPERAWREVTFPAFPLPRLLDAGAPGAMLALNSVVGVDAKLAFFGGKISYDGSDYEFGTVLATDSEPLRFPDRPDAGVAAPAASASALTPDGGIVSAEPTPFDSQCKKPFVILFSVSDAAPADFGYPATRDALLAAPTRPDVEFVEFSFKHHRTLGASAASADQAQALVHLIGDRVKGSKPTLVCFAPSSLIRKVEF